MYLDNPTTSKQYLKSLTTNDREVYSKGYLLACEHMLEAFTKTRTEILNDLLQDSSALSQECGQSQIEVLDYYEDILKKRIKSIETREVRGKPSFSS